MTEPAPQRRYAVREVLNGLRWLVRAGAPWWMLPNDLPPWAAVYQQPQRWLRAGVFEALVPDVRLVLRVAGGRREQPSAAILDSRPLQSSPESGGWAGYDGAKRRRGSKGHRAVGVNTAVRGSLESSTDVDYFAITVTEAGTLRIEVTGTPALVLELRDSSGRLVARSAAGAPGAVVG